MDAKYLTLGSPTLNNGLMTSTAAFLYYLKGLNPKNIKYVVFGSYGWSGQGTGFSDKELESMGHHRLTEPLKIQYTPTKEQLEVLKNEILKCYQAEANK